MARQTVESRVENLEQRMTAIEELPARMDRLELQILQFREEVRGEFSAVRQEALNSEQETRLSLRDEIRAGDEETRRVLREEFQAANVMIVTALTEQIEESRRHTRLLFEEYVARMTTLQNGKPKRRKSR